MQNRDFKGKNWRQPQPERQKAVIGGKAASPAAEGIQVVKNLIRQFYRTIGTTLLNEICPFLLKA